MYLCKHDDRYKNTVNCVNGCIACQLEAAERQRRDNEGQLCKLAAYIQKKYNKNTNSLIGIRTGHYTLVDVAIAIMEGEL